jgi:hypothetical protein
MSEMEKRTWAEISLDNIEHNYRAVKAAIPAGCRYLGVVKADAYGHGAPQVAHRLERAGRGLSGRVLPGRGDGAAPGRRDHAHPHSGPHPGGVHRRAYRPQHNPGRYL